MSVTFSKALITNIISLIMAINVNVGSGKTSLSLNSYSEPELKQQAFEVLKSKCNVCHKRQNPFMIFSMKNMNKKASKIQTQVFELKRMPRGNEIKLEDKERDILKKWLQTTLNQ